MRGRSYFPKSDAFENLIPERDHVHEAWIKQLREEEKQIEEFEKEMSAIVFEDPGFELELERWDKEMEDVHKEMDKELAEPDKELAELDKELAELDKELAELDKESEQFRAENKYTKEQKETEALEIYLKDNNITLTTTFPSGLIYLEKQTGTGPKPVDGKTVKVHYTEKLIDGTKLDSSIDRSKPIEFVLGKGQVIKGWDLGIKLMNVGGKATLIIPSSLAYGERGSGSVIPPYSTLIVDVELIEAEQ
jgi:FKBP-type peptidyl-prolyl cis-trans isomerase